MQRASSRSSSSLIFTVFGSLLTIHGLFADGWAAVAVVIGTFLIARPAAIWIALAGTRLDWASKAFMSWFGPKGVATMTFSLLVLSRQVEAAPEIFDIAALAVLASILVHGAGEDRRCQLDRATPQPALTGRRAAITRPWRGSAPQPPRRLCTIRSISLMPMNGAMIPPSP